MSDVIFFTALVLLTTVMALLARRQLRADKEQATKASNARVLREVKRLSLRDPNRIIETDNDEREYP